MALQLRTHLHPNVCRFMAVEGNANRNSSLKIASLVLIFSSGEAAPISTLMLRYKMPHTFTTARLFRLTSHGQLKADLIVVANYTYAPSPIDNLASIMRMIQGFRKSHRTRSV